jgi:hypothetical protein
MNFKSFGVGVGVGVVFVCATGMLSANSVQAATLAPGSFQIGSGAPPSGSSLTNFTNAGGTTTFDLNFVLPELRLATRSGTFTTLSAGAGGPTVQSLAFSGASGGSVFSNSGSVGFIKNIFLGATEVFVDLDAFSVGNVTNPSNPFSVSQYNLGGGFLGRVRDSSGNVLGIGNLSALRFSNLHQAEIDIATVAAVPTPALLPGLVAMGVAALRKRRGEKLTLVEA